jgi:hypothetical protein
MSREALSGIGTSESVLMYITSTFPVEFGPQFSLIPSQENHAIPAYAGHVARMGEKRNAHRLLVGKPDGKRPLGRPTGRWGDNSKLDLKDIRMG